MKKSIKSIAAFAAALTMTFSCVPKTFAVQDGDVPAAQTEAETEKETKYEFTEGNNFETPYNGMAIFADGEGTVYYRSGDSANRVKIFTLDENGKVKNSFDVENYVNDKGSKVYPTNYNLKQCGDDLYFIYTEKTAFGSMVKNVIVKLDKELNEIDRYSYKKGRSVDTNGEKVVYIKDDNKICICDMDGKNLKTVYTVNKSGDEFEQDLNSIAIAGNYIGFQKRTGYSNEPDSKAYCGMINIETGEITLKEQRSVEQVLSSGDNLIWYGEEGYYPDNDDSSFTFSSDAVANDAYFSSRYKYYDNSELYIFDGENYSVLKTKNKKETGYGAVIDNAGNLVTQSFDGKGHIIFRIYRGGKQLGEHITEYKGYSCFAANNGALTISYTGNSAAPDDWVSYNLSTVTQEELEAELDKTPAAKDKMKSVTIFYK